MSQQRVNKPQGRRQEEQQEPLPQGQDTDAQDAEDLLDEIDEVLEAHAEEFVAQFVQKGGQ